jgi:hypothetical protein
MFRVAIVTFLVSYCTSLSSQPIYSREFEARKKNVPLSIINNHPNYFYLLRYNKSAHDITIERRAKPSAEIISFTPLKLDSLNADWFDYEKLDYLFFENNYHTYFLFKKVLNSKKEIYLKVIDTTGKSSGFIQLAAIEKEQGVINTDLEFKRTTSKTILIIASQVYNNFAEKKVVLLFDIEKRKIIWTKKLPFENSNTGYSSAFECNDANDLFYVLIKSQVVSYKRKNINHTQVLVPVLFYDSLSVVSYLNNSLPIKKSAAINNFFGLNTVRLIPHKESIILNAHFSKKDSIGNEYSYFFNQKFSHDLANENYITITPLNNSMTKSLTFYDGTDLKNVSDKEYSFFEKFQCPPYEFQILERVEEYYRKELIVCKNDLVTGKVIAQKIIPRKIFSFQGRTRFKNIGYAMPFIYNNNLNIIVLESPQNFSKDPNDFDYHNFKKETNLWYANLVMYVLNTEGFLEKKLIFKNSNFDVVPMPYQSIDAKDIIFYLSGSGKEKFVILKLDQL